MTNGKNGEGFAYFRWRIIKNDCCLLTCWSCQQKWKAKKR